MFRDICKWSTPLPQPLPCFVTSIFYLHTEYTLSWKFVFFQVSFDDFEVLFAQERYEANKKQKPKPGTGADLNYHGHSATRQKQDFGPSPDRSGDQEFLPSIQENSAFPEASTPLRLTLSTEDNDTSTPKSPSVILRHKVSRRATLPAGWNDPEYLSPIHAERQKKCASNDLPGTPQYNQLLAQSST